MEQNAINRLVENHPEMYALDQVFYHDIDIYAIDIERIFLKSWLYAGHVSEIPAVGDWFCYELENESVIIVRSSETQVHALANVCRHRGSRVCVEASGRSKRLACRYHGWVYGLDGELVSARYMGDDFDKSDLSLKRLHCEVLDGMIFVNFADEPASFDYVRRGLSECLSPYRLDSAKVAHRQSYPMQANWKLAVENYSECYHCAPAHPEYSRGHGLVKPELERGELYREIMERASACGLTDKQVERSYLEAEAFGADYNYWSYPMIRGHLTGSEDGRPLAPLLGDIMDYNGGCTDFMVGPVTFALAYCDHVVIYAFKPLSLDRCDCNITWLVKGEAVEGKDYDKDRLTWLWDVTTQADKRIIERNAEGVNSRYYEPGPLSKMERGTWQFLEWYLDVMKQP
jgi:Rieske 2Fe-2S family protein